MIASDVYVPATSSAELGLFLKNAGGDDYIGQVWPGASKFPDFLTPTTQYWWTASLMVWQEILPSDGLWLDMNEPSSFCDAVPGVGEWPEGYNYDISGTSGNFSVNRTTAFNASLNAAVTRRSFVLGSRELDASNSTLNTTRMNGGGPNDPALRHPLWCVSISFLSSLTDEPRTDLSASAELYGENGFSALSHLTVSTSGTSHGGPMSAGRGALQFALYGIPMTGSDMCGFNGNSDEELCNRWMQAAFLPFFRSHNTVGAIGQEPYRWDSVAYASRIAISARYALLPSIYTQLATASRGGTPPTRALFYEFPIQPELSIPDTPSIAFAETKPKPFALLVPISEVTTSAAGSAIIDDGISLSTSSLDIAFAATTSSYKSARPLSNVTYYLYLPPLMLLHDYFCIIALLVI
ncbi:glycoside hydrolase family 31 protein [Athelia psychrophila]|uniref:Glycoside hydrolase family 31 protein n=1 Tax=Athelia psychrophila TaxID=1759441 RepID=A0A165YXC9_9AGAM|nr:glycoside hydrolase family 31 protein [Fibularhizoctonia sp. CBS 109695]